jgi:hypothetical protein
MSEKGSKTEVAPLERHVRLPSRADIVRPTRHVRFVPKTEVAFTSLNGQVVSEDVESTGIVDTIAQTVPEGSTPGLQRMNQG